MHILGIFV